MGNERFAMTAYCGTPIDFPFLGKTVFDLAGMRLTLPAPALREHDRTRAAGVIDRSSKTLACLTAEGYFVSSRDGIEVLALIREGFPWQASVGIWPETLEEVKAGDTSPVNGGAFEGPGVVIRTAHVREISFVSLGADPETSVAALAAGAAKRSKPMIEPQDFNGALELMLKKGHRIEVALHEARIKYPRLFEAYCAQLMDLGQPAPDPTRPDVLLAEKAGELAAREGINFEAATARVLREDSDLARRYWHSFTYRP